MKTYRTIAGLTPFLLNLALIVSSGIIFGYLVHLLDVSSDKPVLDVLSEVAVVAFFYWLGFGITSIFKRKIISEKLLGTLDLALISFIGSFGNTVFSIVRNIKGDWEYISLHQNQFYSRHIEPQIGFFIFDVCSFFIIGLFICILFKFVFRLTNSPSLT